MKLADRIPNFMVVVLDLEPDQNIMVKIRVETCIPFKTKEAANKYIDEDLGAIGLTGVVIDMVDLWNKRGNAIYNRP